MIEEELLHDITNLTSKRKSCDKTVNDCGKKLLALCDDYSPLIYNGRCEGDPNGEFTYGKGEVETTIDYCIGSLFSIEFVKSLSVIKAHFRP